MARNIDLQCHTTASDGKLSPKELVHLAIKKKLRAIAITDHDTVDGIDEAIRASKSGGLEVIPGVEISCDDEGFTDTHILGLLINHKEKRLKALLKKAKKYRISQKKEMISNFRKLGFKISYQEVKSLAKGEIGRPHIAKAILKNNSDRVSSIEQIFGEYLAVGKKAYAERRIWISAKEAIEAIHSAGGLAFAAHPGVYENFDAEKFIRFFIECGGDGIETLYDYLSSRKGMTAKENQDCIKRFRKIAKDTAIMETGGSDFHGKPGQILGELKVPYSILEKLKNAREKFKAKHGKSAPLINKTGGADLL